MNKKKYSTAIREALAMREAEKTCAPSSECQVCELAIYCSRCPLGILDETTFGYSGPCGYYAAAARGAVFTRTRSPRWREDILEIALACELFEEENKP